MLKLLVLGAHPDDAEVHAGGLMAAYRHHGHHVRILSLTDGGAGHHQLSSAELVRVRRREAAAAAGVIGAEAFNLHFPDGSLQPTLEVREQVIREIRRFAPDLVLTHRTCDYHPDHRAVGQAVQDASYMVTVPLVVPDTPALRRDPVVAYMSDPFHKPLPLEPDVVLDIAPWIDTVVAMLAEHASQVFQWLPYNKGAEDVPEDPQQRIDWLKAWYAQRPRQTADRFRPALAARYGPERGSQVEFAEAFEISEYAAPLDDAARERLFGFLDD